MSTNTLTKETETKLNDFFTQRIDIEDMAKLIRQVNYTLALGLLKDEAITNLESNYYWLNELAEILNPYLDKE